MGTILLIGCLIFMAGIGFWVMEKLDRFFEENYRGTGEKEAEPVLRAGLENPAWIGSLGDVLEKNSCQDRKISVLLYRGDILQIRNVLKNGGIELGIIEEEPEAAKDPKCSPMKIPGRKTRILAKRPHLPVEALGMEPHLFVTVLWNTKN